MSDKTFPNESAEYRTARNQLLLEEIRLRSQIEAVAAQRRTLPLGGRVKEDYVFESLRSDGLVHSLLLSELFLPGQNTLIIYSYMFGPNMALPCTSCTSLIDGFNGTSPHVTQRVNRVVAAKSPIERIMEVARARKWDNLRLLSTSKSTYNTDYLAEDAEGNQLPMVNVFVKRDGGVYHFWGSEMLYSRGDADPRHVDLLWPLWNFFDLTPEGRGADWYPRLSYAPFVSVKGPA